MTTKNLQDYITPANTQGIQAAFTLNSSKAAFVDKEAQQRPATYRLFFSL